MSLKMAVIKKAPHVFVRRLFLDFCAAITAFRLFQNRRGHSLLNAPLLVMFKMSAIFVSLNSKK